MALLLTKKSKNFDPTHMQVAIAVPAEKFPISSNPLLHLYMTWSPGELPVINMISPLAGGVG